MQTRLSTEDDILFFSTLKEANFVALKTLRFNPLACDAEGRTALHHLAGAFLRGNLIGQKILSGEITIGDVTLLMQQFIDSGAKVNARDSAGMTPLNYVGYNTERKDTEEVNTIHPLVELLIENGANPNIASSDGETPLHWSAKLGFSNCIKSLLLAHADPSATIIYGTARILFTPIELAKAYEKDNIVLLLSVPPTTDLMAESPSSVVCPPSITESDRYTLFSEKRRSFAYTPTNEFAPDFTFKPVEIMGFECLRNSPFRNTPAFYKLSLDLAFYQGWRSGFCVEKMLEPIEMRQLESSLSSNNPFIVAAVLKHLLSLEFEEDILNKSLKIRHGIAKAIPVIQAHYPLLGKYLMLQTCNVMQIYSAIRQERERLQIEIDSHKRSIEEMIESPTTLIDQLCATKNSGGLFLFECSSADVMTSCNDDEVHKLY